MLAMNRNCRADSTDEQGSVMITVAIITILSVVAVTLFSSVNSGLRRSRADQDRTDAFQFASAGIDQALYRIDSSNLELSASPGSTYIPTVVGGVLTKFEETLAEDGQKFTVTARPTPVGQDARWTVTSLGTDKSGRQRQAVATIEAELLFENGFFTENLTEMNGSPDFPEAYNSAVSPNPLLSRLLPRYATSIVTNGRINLKTKQTYDDWNAKWQSYNMYGRPTTDEARANCVNCAPDLVHNFPDSQPTYVIPIPSNAKQCPGGGTITALHSPIDPGDYTCQELSFSGEIDIAGSGVARFWPTRKLTINNEATLNGPSGGSHQRPQRLQIFYYDPSIYGVPEAEAETLCRL